MTRTAVILSVTGMMMRMGMCMCMCPGLSRVCSRS